ncbi:MAG: hypothetical protein JWO19_3867 [Bryobacterales bacterium]|nr:hypothetical protein [Bryobacterales bacterium]
MTARILIVVLATATLYGQKEAQDDARLRHATEVFQDIAKSPDKGIPQDLFTKAQCVVVVPDLVKGAFLVGGKYGRGYASCRHGNGWSSPAAVRIEGGSFGLQLGGSSTDLVMLVMNRSGMDHLLSDKFTLGGEASAAAGPVGRQTSAQTDAALHAEILTWSRSRGLFAGLSLEGATLRPDSDENRKLYGRDITNRQILETGVPTPRAARQFMAVLNGFSREANRVEAAEKEPASKRLSRPGGRVSFNDKQVHFDTGQSAIANNAAPALSDVAQALKDNPSWKVRIEGYTDSVGSNASNMKLSQDRARAVMIWLTDHGVDRSRIAIKGYGEDHPVGDNSTDEGRAKNRRVEVVRTDSAQASE